MIPIRLDLAKSLRGTDRTIVITAMDKWENESGYSTEQVIHLGGYKPRAPVLSPLEALTTAGADKIKLTWPKVTLDINGDITNVTKYRYIGVYQIYCRFISKPLRPAQRMYKNGSMPVYNVELHTTIRYQQWTIHLMNLVDLM